MRTVVAALGFLALVVLLSGTSAVGSRATATPAGGAIVLLDKPSGNGNSGTIVITGAIGDYGTDVNVGLSGKFAEITLQKGTFLVNLKAFNAKQAKAHPIVDMATCSFRFSASSPDTVLNGTGLYKGISGSGNLTVTSLGIGPLYKSGAHKGQCNMGQGAPLLAQSTSITGTGIVKFS